MILTPVLREALVGKHPWIIESCLAASGLHVHIAAVRDMEIPYGLIGV